MKHLILILIGVISLLSGYVRAQGLRFFGNESRIAERSSWCVFDENNTLPEVRQLSISFKYDVQNYYSPGYIFYLKDAKGDRAYNLTYVHNIVEKPAASCSRRMGSKFSRPLLYLFRPFTAGGYQSRFVWILSPAGLISVSLMILRP